MTGKEIEVLAAKNAPLPDGLDVPERYLFLCLRIDDLHQVLCQCMQSFCLLGIIIQIVDGAGLIGIELRCSCLFVETLPVRMIQCDLHSEFLHRIRNIKVRLVYTISVISVIQIFSFVISPVVLIHTATHFLHHLILMTQHSVFVDPGL